MGVILTSYTIVHIRVSDLCHIVIINKMSDELSAFATHSFSGCCRYPRKNATKAYMSLAEPPYIFYSIK